MFPDKVYITFFQIAYKYIIFNNLLTLDGIDQYTLIHIYLQIFKPDPCNLSMIVIRKKHFQLTLVL